MATCRECGGTLIFRKSYRQGDKTIFAKSGKVFPICLGDCKKRN